MYRLFLNSLFLLIVITGYPQNVTVKVFPEIKRQKIVSIGGNYCQANYTDHAWDAVGEETLKQLKPRYVRVALPLRIRNKKYEAYRGDKFLQEPLVIKLLESMKRMKYEYGVENITVSVWNVADELVKNPDERSQRVIKPKAYDEIIDMLVAFLLKAKNEYGVEVNYFSFNESDGGWMVLFSHEETIEFIKKAGKKMEAVGLKTKFLWADTAQTEGTVEFATLIMADQSIWKYLGPLCFHSWWSENIPDNEFERIAGLAKAYNKPVWCSELGFDAHAHKVKGMNASWNYGLRFAKISHRMIKYARVEVSMYWTWQNNYSVMSADLKTKYPSYYVTRHLTDFLNEDTQIVHSLSSDAEILPISGIYENGNQVLQLINLKKEAVFVKIEGYQSILVDMVTTTENKLWEEAEYVAKSKNGTIRIQLKPESVNTLIIK